MITDGALSWMRTLIGYNKLLDHLLNYNVISHISIISPPTTLQNRNDGA